ncbi:hypothetical protein [Mesobacillus jeotgali]|jgi:hypothetical protein|uniref:Copper amine oxidase-like N-terminal domain-containing protein n=1 Tax=Mesobacillus jeotgali TaxID=129985 RepID=A0ABY9VKX3_9BACI|nr:hypothetical protein [Mesobacillus jeotgali]WNF24363.1 hypothetical protein RH061_07720 [Mesobacillus jeotgali]
MKKVSILMISGLFIIICAAVLWQWHVFSKNSDKPAGPKEELSIIAAVKVEENRLLVKQTFRGLDANRQYKAVIPAQLTEVNCTDAAGNPCEDGFEKLPKGKDIQFEYMIESGPGFSLLLNDWMIVLKDASFAKTRIEIVDHYNRKGTWAAGLPLKGFKQTELLHYYVFEGENSNPSLYWQEKPLFKLSGQKEIKYYTSHKEQAIYEFASLARLSDKHLSVVITDGQRAVHGNGLLLAGNKLNEKELERELASALLASKFGTDRGKEGFTLEALTSLVIKQEPENAKSKAMAAELENTLSAIETVDFITYFSKERQLDASSLDKYLSSIKGMNTKFFLQNSTEDQEFFPLLFTDARSVIVNGKERDELEVVVKNDEHLFPLVSTMAAIGYKTKVGTDFTIMELSSASSKYSFNLKNKTFMIDGQSFGLLENPFKYINGEWYLEKQWFHGIFKVEISEKSDSFILES